MSAEPQYQIVYATRATDRPSRCGSPRSWPQLLRHLREMREDYGSLLLMQTILRLPDPVERVR